MLLNCALNLLAESLDCSLTVSTASLNDVGRTKSINSFEVEMRNWATAFFLYSDSASVHFERCFVRHEDQGATPEFITGPSRLSFDYSVTKNLLDHSFSSIINLTQELFDTLQHEVQKSILIPRVKNHLALGTTKIRSGFLDHHELIIGLSTHNLNNFDTYHQGQVCTTELLHGEADGGKWILDWMKNHLKTEAIETINAMQLSQ
tara:strand:+ start:3047 stop:3661 length:615 start_codon:yes stop_codon:yes gene_type:complete